MLFYYSDGMCVGGHVHVLCMTLSSILIQWVMTAKLSVGVVCVHACVCAIARVSGNSIPTSEYEIQNIISSLNSKKSVGSNSIPTRTLKLLKNDISTQLADIFNNSFSTGIFPT